MTRQYLVQTSESQTSKPQSVDPGASLGSRTRNLTRNSGNLSALYQSCSPLGQVLTEDKLEQAILSLGLVRTARNLTEGAK